MNRLRYEWKAVVSTVKAHEQFKSYTLVKLVEVLRSHEDEVTKNVKIVYRMESLALHAKGKKVAEEDYESDLSECDLTKEEYDLLVSNPKKLAKKNFGRFKKRNRMWNYISYKLKDESFKNSRKDEEKEKKFLGDSGYDYNYCHGKNHFAKECILRRLNEKKEAEKDEAYYLQKIEDLRKKSVGNAKPDLIV